MNKTFIWILFLLMLVGGGIWLYKMPREVQVVSTPGMVTYTDPQGIFSLQYPEAFSIAGRDGTNLVTVSVPRGYLPQTNFSEAKLTISSITGGTDATCKGTSTTSDAAAGNRYETTTLKKIYDGDCYTFESLIHSTNIGNYDPSQGITEFDKTKIKNQLDAVVQSFKYLVNSN